MKRASFLISGTAALSLFPVLSEASVNISTVREIAQNLPGRLGVYAQTLSEDYAPITLNATEVFPSASIIKLLIAVSVYRVADTTPHFLEQSVNLRASDLVGDSDVLAHAQPGDAYRVHQLVRAAIVQSDNSAANTLITLLGLEAINKTARLARLPQTQLGRHFADTGYFAHSVNLTSPRDMGSLLLSLERAVRTGIPMCISSASARAVIEMMLQQVDRDKLARGLPPQTVLANKSGEMSHVRNDVGIVAPFGDAPYVIAVLTKELHDITQGDEAIRNVAQLVHRTFSQYSSGTH